MLNTVWQRQCEAAVVLACCVAGFMAADGELWVWAVWFFLPDASIAAYWAGPRWGARAYNTVHFYGFPLILLAWGVADASVIAQWAAFIWAGHIAFDRTLGWGLKYPDSFFSTDMGVKSFPFGLLQSK